VEAGQDGARAQSPGSRQPGGVLTPAVHALVSHTRHTQKRLRGAGKRALNGPVWRALTERTVRLQRLASAVATPLRASGELDACPACRSTSIVLLDPFVAKDTAGLRVVFATGCRDCGLLFANPQPDAAMLQQLYSPDGKWGHTWRQSADKRREYLKRQAARALAGIRKPNPPRGRRDALFEALDRHVTVFDPPAGAAVLDFGCGDGKLLNVLLDHGWRTFGIEPSSDVAFLRHERLLAVPDSPRFDLVIAHHVIEHIPQPLDLLRVLARAIKPGGALFVSVPRLDTLPHHRDFHYCLNGRTHVVAFSEACLRELLARAALEPLVALDDPALDAAITSGVPLRLRMIARKAGTTPGRQDDPLAAATRALRAYGGAPANSQWLTDAKPLWFESWLPVRVRGALLDRRRRDRERQPSAGPGRAYPTAALES
jgi:SAM-dependent methyltransferase